MRLDGEDEAPYHHSDETFSLGGPFARAERARAGAAKDALLARNLSHIS